MLAGLTGGMACGKSFVARTMAQFGAHVIEADELGREVMQPGAEAFGAIVTAFGRDILTSAGEIDRARLAAKVFQDPAALNRLNTIVHPAVRARAICQAEHHWTEDPECVVVYAAAILIESGAYRECHKLIVVSCTEEQQLERALSRGMDHDGATDPVEVERKKADVRARLARQMPLDEKRKYADFLIDSSGTKEDTVRQTKLVYDQLVSLSRQKGPE